jgi:hypothetical protein
MAFQELDAATAALDSLSLNSTDTKPTGCLPFRRPVGRPLSSGPVDHNLYRMFDYNATGEANEMFVKSMDARSERSSGSQDIFIKTELKTVAGMLSQHLWWKYRPCTTDNLVS